MVRNASSNAPAPSSANCPFSSSTGPSAPRRRPAALSGLVLPGALAASAVLAALAGCGGGSDDAQAVSTGAAATTTAPHAQPLSQATTEPTPPASTAAATDTITTTATTAMTATAALAARPRLAADFARESPYGPGDMPGTTAADDLDRADRRLGTAAAVPVDAQARTKSGRYIGRAAAEQFDHESGGEVVWVDASCCAGLDPDLPVHITFGMQAVRGTEARIFVGGRDLREAARLADRLEALGLRRVHLVTP